jgi:hypothetical protein
MADYFVICSFGYGMGSWARDADLEKAVKRCKRIAYSDWRGVLKLDGATVNLSLFDVTGNDTVSFGDGSVTGDNPDAPIKSLGLREVTFPKSR